MRSQFKFKPAIGLPIARGNGNATHKLARQHYVCATKESAALYEKKQMTIGTGGTPTRQDNQAGMQSMYRPDDMNTLCLEKARVHRVF